MFQRPASASAALRGLPVAAGSPQDELQQQWWSEARRASQATAKASTRISRSATNSPVPEEVLQAVAQRRSIASGNHLGAKALAAPQAAAADWRTSIGTSFQQAPTGQSGRGVSACAAAAVQAQEQAQTPQMRRSMVAAGAPPPSAQGAYVADRAVGSFSTARSSQKSDLLSYLQAHSGTVSRVLGSPPPPDPSQQLPPAQYVEAAAGGYSSYEGSQADARINFASSGAAPTGSGWSTWSPTQRTQGVFVWEDEPPIDQQIASNASTTSTPNPRQQQRPAAEPPANLPAAGWRSASPQDKGDRKSLAAAAAIAAGRAASPTYGRLQRGSVASSSQLRPESSSPLGTRGAEESVLARRTSTAAYLEGSQRLVDHISCEMPVYEGPLQGGPGEGAGDAGYGGDRGTRHSAIGTAISARLSAGG